MLHSYRYRKKREKKEYIYAIISIGLQGVVQSHTSTEHIFQSFSHCLLSKYINQNSLTVVWCFTAGNLYKPKTIKTKSMQFFQRPFEQGKVKFKGCRFAKGIATAMSFKGDTLSLHEKIVQEQKKSNIPRRRHGCVVKKSAS